MEYQEYAGRGTECEKGHVLEVRFWSINPCYSLPVSSLFSGILLDFRPKLGPRGKKQISINAGAYEVEEITDIGELERVYDIPEPHSPGEAAYEQAKDIEIDVESELGSRVDLRELSTIPIDPDDAQDHDDAISLVEEDGGYRAYVHIADVGHYVEPGSAIAESAEQRGVTFYLGDEETRHMLPPRLAQEICSLKPDRDRLAHTVEFKMDENGKIQGETDIYKSVVRSDARLTYTHADSIIDSADEILGFYDENEVEHGGDEEVENEIEGFQGMCEALMHLDSLTEKLRHDRWDQSLILNNRQSNSSRIVEEMMVSANMVVGDYLRENAPGIYRVHPVEPGWTIKADRNLRDEGFDVPDDLHTRPKKALNDFFRDKVSDSDHEAAEKAVVTSLERAVYEPMDGSTAFHFGLGMEDYAHFTSPIRRDTDLLNHWLISEALEGDIGGLERIAEHASEQQEEADKASKAWHKEDG